MLLTNIPKTAIILKVKDDCFPKKIFKEKNLSLKRFLPTLIFFLFFLLSFSIYFFNSRRNQQKSFSEFSIPTPFAIEITKNDSKSILITNSGEWMIVKPITEKADEEKVRKLINELNTLKAENVFTNFKGLKEYGLNPPIVKLKVYSENKMKELWFGERSIDEKYRYFITVEETNKIFLCYSYKIETPFEDLSDFREKGIFFIPSGEIEKIILKTKKELYILKPKNINGEKQWVVVNKNEKFVNGFNEKLVDIYSLSVANFLEGEKSFMKNYEISIYSKDLTNTLWFSGKIEDKKWLAKAQGKNGLFIVESDNLDNIFKVEEK